ncbi:MAG TPA: hypothetical protein VLJ37_03010 [bacterium]|nr:hypothetical protein [bacterium]
MKKSFSCFVAVLAIFWALSWGGPSGCGGATCGDGVIGGSEVCDGSALNGETCETRGFSPDGTLTCAGDCGSLDTSGCVDRGTVSGLTFITGDNDEFVELSPDPQGRLYLTIRSGSTSVTAGGKSIANTAVSPASWRASAARLNDDGSAAWLLPFQGNGAFSDNGATFSFDPAGNIFFSGDFYGTTMIAPDRTVTNADATGATIDAFAGRFDSDGSVLWFDSFQSANHDQVFPTFGPGGQLYIGGNFNGSSITVGSKTLNNTDTVGTTPDRFLARLDPSSGTVAWVSQFGSDADDGVFPLVDASGNLFVWGYFQGVKLAFNGTDVATNADPSGTTTDSFIARLDPATGDLDWITPFASAKFDSVNLIVDPSGNPYAYGSFLGNTLSAGGKTLTNADPSETTADDFVARINPGDGTVSWLSGVSSDDFDMITLQTDSAGDLFLSGVFDGATLTSGSKTLPNADGGGTSNDNFVARLDPADGSTRWITGLTGPGFGGGFMGPIPLAVDAVGNVYLAATFFGATLDVGGRTLTNTDVSAMTGDAFAAKILPDGAVDWVASFAGDDEDSLRLAFAAGSENPSASAGIFVVGSFASTSLSADGRTLTNADATKTTYDAFLASLDPADGTIVWLVPFSSTGEDSLNAVTDASGSVHFGIRFEGPTLDVTGQTFTNQDASVSTTDAVTGRIAR